MKLSDNKPVFLQIKAWIEDHILRGEWRAGEQLPSVRALAREVGVNPNTVAKAYQQLEQQGIIYTVSGRGSFVSPDVLSLQSLRQAALQEVLDAVDKALSRGVSPQQLLDAIRQQLDSLSPCNQGGTQDD